MELYKVNPNQFIILVRLSNSGYHKKQGTLFDLEKSIGYNKPQGGGIRYFIKELIKNNIIEESGTHSINNIKFKTFKINIKKINKLIEYQDYYNDVIKYINPVI